MLAMIEDRIDLLVQLCLDIELLELLEMRMCLTGHIDNGNIAADLSNSESQRQTDSSGTTGDDNRSTFE